MTRKTGFLVGFVMICLVAAAIWIAPKVLRRLDMQGLRPVTIASGLDNPWSLAFLPDGRMLVTERPGRMRLVGPDGALSEPLRGLPPVHAKGEGGLMDVALDPQFARNSRLYWSYSEPDAGGAAGSSTAVARGRLAGTAIEDVAVIFRQPDKVDDSSHFGSRLLFASDGRLFVSLGDRSRRQDVQSLASQHGKILRMESDGRAPPDNPFAQTAGALPQVWTLGHRNVQGLATQPATGIAVGQRTRAAGGRRAQPGRARPQLRLASDHPWLRVRVVREDRRGHFPRRHAAAGRPLVIAGDRTHRHGVPDQRPLPRMER